MVYVSKNSYFEACSIQEDIQSNPILNFLSKFALSTFFILAFCLGYTCFKYKRLESHYQLMSNDGNIESEIARRQQNAQKRRKD